MIVIEVDHTHLFNIDIDLDLQEEGIQGLHRRGIIDRDQDHQDNIVKDHLRDVLDHLQEEIITDADLLIDIDKEIVPLRTAIDHILINREIVADKCLLY